MEDDAATEFTPSSSESASGAARFFPFRSLVGSLIVRDEVVADGKVALLALEPRQMASVRHECVEFHRMTHLLEVRIESSVVSFAFPFPEGTSRERLFFEFVGLSKRAVSGGALDCSTVSLSLSLACSRSFSFCLEAFTLALERSGLDCKVVVELEAERIWAGSDWGSWEVLELVASC